MAIVLNGTSGITNDSGYTGDGVSFADSTPANTLVTTSGGNVGIGTSSPVAKLELGAPNAINTTNTFRISNPYYNNWDITNGVGAFLAFSRGGSEFMRIDSSGNLLVGATSADPTVLGVRILASATIPQISVAVSATSNNYLLYNTAAAAYRFFVSSAGQINATSTSITAISDQSLKENIRDLDTGLAQVMALRPRRFDWKEETQIGEKNVAGFIAQEVEQVLPELVYDYQYTEGVTKKSLKMGDILPTLVKAIQELKAINDAQAQTINAQQTALESLTARVVALEGA